MWFLVFEIWSIIYFFGGHKCFYFWAGGSAPRPRTFSNWHPSRNRLASTAYFAKPGYVASLPRLLLTIVRYKIHNNSKTNNCKKKNHGYKNFDQNNAHILVFDFFFHLGKKLTKSDYISKTKNRTKKIIYAKNKRHVNFNLPVNLATFKISWIFGRPKHPFWTPKRDMMWYEISRP